MVQTQGPELVVATAHTHPPHSNVGGELGVGRLATQFIPAINSSRRSLGCCCCAPSQHLAALIQCTLLLPHNALPSSLLLLLAPVLLASTGCPAFVQRITGNTCSKAHNPFTLGPEQGLTATCGLLRPLSAKQPMRCRPSARLSAGAHPWLTTTPERSLGARKEGETVAVHTFRCSLSS